MKKVFKILLNPLFGLVLFIAALIYDTTFAGIPYQDPTQAMQDKWNFHSTIANYIYIIGLIIFFAGIIRIIFVKNKKTVNKT